MPTVKVVARLIKLIIRLNERRDVLIKARDRWMDEPDE